MLGPFKSTIARFYCNFTNKNYAKRNFCVICARFPASLAANLRLPDVYGCFICPTYLYREEKKNQVQHAHLPTTVPENGRITAGNR